MGSVFLGAIRIEQPLMKKTDISKIRKDICDNTWPNPVVGVVTNDKRLWKNVNFLFFSSIHSFFILKSIA